MTFEEYAGAAANTALYPNRGANLVYPTLGLVGESGEVAEKVKKIIRDHEGHLTQSLRQELIKECGDVLWYLAAIAHELNTSLDEMAQVNLAKLASRNERNMIKGSGDNR